MEGRFGKLNVFAHNEIQSRMWRNKCIWTIGFSREHIENGGTEQVSTAINDVKTLNINLIGAKKKNETPIAREMNDQERYDEKMR